MLFISQITPKVGTGVVNFRENLNTVAYIKIVYAPFNFTFAPLDILYLKFCRAGELGFLSHSVQRGSNPPREKLREQ